MPRFEDPFETARWERAKRGRPAVDLSWARPWWLAIPAATLRRWLS